MRRALIVVLSVFATWTFPQGLQAQEIGLPEWVAPRAQGTPPAQAARDLVPGTSLNAGEEILTGERGAIDIVFTSSNARLLVGPRCTTKLDAPYYDPVARRDARAPSVTTDTRCLVRADATVGSSFLREVLPGEENAITLLTPLAVIYVIGAEAVVDLRERQSLGMDEGGGRFARRRRMERLPLLIEAAWDGRPVELAQLRSMSGGTVRVTKLSEEGRVVLVSDQERRTLTRAGETLTRTGSAVGFEGPVILAAGQIGDLLGAFEGLTTPLPLTIDVAFPPAPATGLPDRDLGLRNPCLDTFACQEGQKDTLRRQVPPTDTGETPTPVPTPTTPTPTTPTFPTTPPQGPS